VTATRAADANYSQATSNTVTYTFALATQAALSVTSVSGTATTPLALTVGGGSGTGAVTYVVTDGTTTCTLANGSVIAAAAGTCLVTATKAADAAYSQAVSPQATLTFAAAPVVALIGGGGGASPAPAAPPVTAAPAPDAWATPVATVEAKAGQNVLVVGDKVISASTEVTADKQGLKVVTPDWQFTLKVQASAGAAANQEATSGTQLVVTTGQTVAVAGDKFQAGSTVKVWIFSDPILLGTVKVNPDGSFASTLSVPTGLELGNHTLVLQGVNSKNEVQNAQASLLLKAANTAPAAKPVSLSAVVRFAIGSAHVSTVTHRILAQLMHQLAGLKQITISAVTYYRHPASAPRAAKLGAQRAAVLRKALKRAGIQATVSASTAATSVAANVGQPLVISINATR
jgi:outer membrane protein OmpA-like peptidoglycan-associated protein